MRNVDERTVSAFDYKWGAKFSAAADDRHDRRMFDAFFGLLPLHQLSGAEGFDLGCGVGRHAEFVAPRVGLLHCVDPSPNAIDASRAALAQCSNVKFHLAGVDDMPIPDGSQDFGYSMGVLHHLPDTEGALETCVRKLKPGAPFLLYLYYRFDNRPLWFRATWWMSDVLRRFVCRLPSRARKLVCDTIAVSVYWPLSRVALVAGRIGMRIEHFPLSFYGHTPLPNLRVSSLDRFGTPLERRFTRREIEAMMRRAGLEQIEFQESAPYWVALGRRSHRAHSLRAALEMVAEEGLEPPTRGL